MVVIMVIVGWFGTVGVVLCPWLLLRLMCGSLTRNQDTNLPNTFMTITLSLEDPFKVATMDMV